MKIDNIDIYAVTVSGVRFLNLNFRDPNNESPYIAKEIVGLDADEIVSRFYGTDLANKKYYDLSLNKREVVFRIGLNPNYSLGQTYSSLRDAVYTLVSASRTGQVEIRVKVGGSTKGVVSGFITKIDSPAFTNSPEVYVTIKCDNGMLKALEETNFDISGLNLGNTVVEDNISSAPHGFRFGVIFTGNISDFSVQDQEIPNWAFEVGLTGSPLLEFSSGDELHFSSEISNRYLYLIKDLEIIHLVDRIIPTSIWPVMFPGLNSFILSDSVDWDYITYYPTYWGI